MTDHNDELYTKRQYLLMKAFSRTGDWDAAIGTVALETEGLPDREMNERKTYLQWEGLR